MCIEYAGDEFLRVKKTKYALQCYNIARVYEIFLKLILSIYLLVYICRYHQ